MKWHFFGKNDGKPKLNSHIMIYILSLLDHKSLINASEVNQKWKEMVELTQKYISLLPTIRSIPILSYVGLDVLRLKMLAGGMTNTTFRVQIGANKAKYIAQIPGVNPDIIEKNIPQRWVLRIPGEVSSFAVSRQNEAKNATKASALGLNVPIAHFDAKGLQLTKYIDGVKTLDSEMLKRVDVLKTLASKAKLLHSSEPFANDLAVFDRNANLFQILKESKFKMPPNVAFIEDQMEQLQNLFSLYQVELSPCHNDSTPLNYMLACEGKEKKEVVYQIDWEYSSNNDFMWDLVYFAIEAKLTKDQELIYLSAYFDVDKVSDSVWAWYTAYKPVVQWWITLWSWTQVNNDAKSVDKKVYEELGLERYQMTLDHLESEEYKSALSLIVADSLSTTFNGHRLF